MRSNVPSFSSSEPNRRFVRAVDTHTSFTTRHNRANLRSASLLQCVHNNGSSSLFYKRAWSIQEWCSYTNTGEHYLSAIIDISLLINDMIISFQEHLLVVFWWLTIRNAFSSLWACLLVVFAIFILCLLSGWRGDLVVILCSFAMLDFCGGSCPRSWQGQGCPWLVLGDLDWQYIAWLGDASCEGMEVTLTRVRLQPFLRTRYRPFHRRATSWSTKEPSKQVFLLMIFYLISPLLVE